MLLLCSKCSAHGFSDNIMEQGVGRSYSCLHLFGGKTTFVAKTKFDYFRHSNQEASCCYLGGEVGAQQPGGCMAAGQRVSGPAGRLFCGSGDVQGQTVITRVVYLLALWSWGQLQLNLAVAIDFLAGWIDFD